MSGRGYIAQEEDRRCELCNKANEPLTPELIAEKVKWVIQLMAHNVRINSVDVNSLIGIIAQFQRQLAELSADHKRACLSLRSVERQLAEARNRPIEGWTLDTGDIHRCPDLEAIKQQARKDALLDAAVEVRVYTTGEKASDRLIRMANASPTEPPK